MVLGTFLGWRPLPTVVVSVALAFLFGYAWTMRPLLRSGLSLAASARLALAADSLSITVMEIVDNVVMLLFPGAMEASVTSGLFWGSLALALVLAGMAAYPVNLWLLKRGQGHSLVHQHHTGASRGRKMTDGSEPTTIENR